ncbi:ATP-binding protein [Alicyclobacillus fodiniaquatilis]|uniref:histidine kinase n=1 Tax=Alicyclobacillus fodiniaquatilis TaxID=1661150 RepID=A0ABW4JI58_9BACL
MGNFKNYSDTLLGDENRVRQILFNLIGNAIKYTDAGSVTLSALEKEGFVQLSIIDTGIGIPSDKFDMIFQSFEQVDSSITREYGGTGLGLTITKSLVELHGGTISVESTVGIGSCFIFTLPLADNALIANNSNVVPVREDVALIDYHSEIAATKTNDIVAHSADVRILIVDDDPVNVQVVTNHLTNKGWKTLTAYSGPEALEILESEKVDLVLLDVMMPKMSGLEVCSRIREMYTLNDLPVILLTAKNSMDDFILGFKAGANDYLTKPFMKEELNARIEAHVQVAKASLELRQLKEGVQTGTSFLRHAIKNDIGLIDVFSNKIKSYAVQNNMETLIHDSDVILNKNANLLALMKRINTMTAEITLYPEKGDIRETVKTVINRIQDKLETNKTTVKCSFGPGSQFELNYDQAHIEEVIRNVLQNAMEALGSQRTRVIHVSIRSIEEFCEISIKDNGEGIPKENLESIYHLYFSTKKREGNFGLGLYYCANVIKKHSGKITVDSNLNGTTVTLRLPYVFKLGEVQNA